MNAGEPWPSTLQAWSRVLGIQAKLHQWAGGDPARRFDGLFNLVADPAVQQMAWDRVRTKRGARTAGVDGQTAYYVEQVRGVEAFLADLRGQLRSREFVPVAVRERMMCAGWASRRRRGRRRAGACDCS